MTKTVKIISWILGALLTVLTVGLFIIYWWVSTKWTDFYTKDEMQFITDNINAAPSFTDNFYQAFDLVYPDQRNKTLIQMYFTVAQYTLTRKEQLIRDRQCDCILAAGFIDDKTPSKYHSWSRLIIAHGLEKYTTEQKCLDFYYSEIAIQDFSFKYFNKPFNTLTVDECIETLLRLQSPTLYDQRPELLTEKINELTR